MNVREMTAIGPLRSFERHTEDVLGKQSFVSLPGRQDAPTPTAYS
jgi:hypothetical protein